MKKVGQGRGIADQSANAAKLPKKPKLKSFLEDPRLDDRGVELWEIARKLGYHPRYEQCEEIVAGLGKHYLDSSLVLEMLKEMRIPEFKKTPEA